MSIAQRVLCILASGLALSTVGCSKPPSQTVAPAADAAPPAPATPVAATASLADLQGPEWKLDRYSDNEPVAADVAITLAVADSRVSGHGGCNRYTGSVSTVGPGKITVGPLAATMMACVPPRDVAEQRYLKALQQATSYAIEDGRLLITYKDGDTTGTLAYSRT